jgi:16S rRNA (cytidine1402-2'-O)-methyltransferase
MTTIYVTGTSITGDYSDTSDYVKEIASSCTLIIGEDRKNLGRFKAAVGCRDTEQMLLNEHSLDREKEFLVEVAGEHEKVMLISDAGTPCVADPGYDFIDMAWKEGFHIISVPGPSSIIAALSVSGFFSERFHFAGFPPKEKVQRKKFMDRVKNNRDTVVLMERPYTAVAFIEELAFLDKKMSMSFNLGMPDEETFRGTAKQIRKKLPDNIKKPFVIVISK